MNREIHNRIMAGSGNRSLIKIYECVASRVFHSRYKANQSLARWAAAIAKHEQIIRFLEARDAERLGPILRLHVRNKLAALQAAKNPDSDSD